MFLKKIIPLKIKKGFHYLLLYPERQELGIGKSLLIEFKSRIHLFWNSKKNIKPTEPTVSICIGIWNRTENFLISILPSIVSLEKKEKFELSIFDCGSEDFSHLVKEIEKVWEGKKIIISENLPFSRAFAFHKAIENSKGEIIFVCDADIAFPSNLYSLSIQNTSKKNVWFPQMFTLKKGAKKEINPQNGYWFEEGKGMFICYKNQYNQIGGFNQKFIAWGGEDWDIFSRFYKAGLFPLRTKTEGFFHYWHEGHKSKISRDT